jgi:chaperonin GroES
MIQPIGSKILIQAKAVEEKTAAGIVLPGMQGKKQLIAKVIAVGAGHLLDNGTTVPLTIQPGDEVIYEGFAGTKVSYQGNEYLVIDERDVLVRVGEEIEI